MNAKWQDLKQSFKAIPLFYDNLSVIRIPHPEDKGAWHLEGSLPEQYQSQFKTVAQLAGKELTVDMEIKSILPAEILQEADPLNRWFLALQLMVPNAYQPRELYKEWDDGRRQTLFVGMIKYTIQSSISLCGYLEQYEKPAETTPTDDKPIKESTAITRVGIVRNLITSVTDFAHREKVKALCETLDLAGIPIPQRKAQILSGKAGLHGNRLKSHTWMEVFNSPTGAQYKWLFGHRSSPLLTDLYKSKKQTLRK